MRTQRRRVRETVTRGRTNWVVAVHELDSGELPEIYGPYTQRQAEETKERVQRFFALAAEALDKELDDVVVITAYPLDRWASPADKVEKGPSRPLCPLCQRKMRVWQLNYGRRDMPGKREMYGQCLTPGCDWRNLEFQVRVEGDRYVLGDTEDYRD
jgi:hypothetical protein